MAVQTIESRHACQECRPFGTGDTSQMNQQLQLSHRTEMKSMCVSHQFVMAQSLQKDCVLCKGAPAQLWGSSCSAFWTKGSSKSALRQILDVLLKEMSWF